MISSRIKIYTIRFCIIAFIFLMSGGAWVIYTAITESLYAEHALHAVNMMTIITEQYVKKEGKWPQSWDDLILHTDAQEYAMYSWPDDSMKIRKYVTIDFKANPIVLSSQNVDNFEAIQPIGPCYIYKHNGHIASLIETIQKRDGR